jgi:hypothetical protein
MEKDLKRRIVMNWLRGVIWGSLPSCPRRDQQFSKSFNGGWWKVVCL